MLIFAHRGASGVAPENTLRSIRTALEAEVDGIEIDIHEVDGKLFVIHDRWLHRTTSGQGQIFNYDYQYLRSLDAGDGEVIPTLDEVLKLIAGKCTINIELKAVRNLTLLFSCIDDAIKTTELLSNDVLFSSFNHRLLHAIQQQRSDFAIGALTACYPLDYAKFAEQLNAYSVHLDVDFISEHFVADAHKRGLKVFVYTVDELEDINAMKHLGVDGIFSNYPTKAKSHIAHLNGIAK
ncbi:MULTISPECIES: glycerophosphodiester phosphodiesterase [Colwellia]|jgi:glycerophosphoryl diester phosphodiesterase|uniref:Glycerophosphoryl diester phosphodiesterase family protein n=1 Tax=Colwellia psychrerythraea (strain 34H / ATCC BAA-681) TaxID=167879 RepID=Q487V1_COLP3|nr:MULTISPECIES: glycerophosphodiester phosphodiesterase family protein [Colwellia]AAZ27169.1 glycerophosphoryl diester phosphodiesterase family protein [Colwellia psychrerythraea 34H]PKH89544.1 glycerophosphodiester phosphodiesterase [Colwellia sp. Bg11-28]